MKKQIAVFNRLSTEEMKSIKGGVMPPLFKYNCKMGGVDVLGVCFFENPEPHCGYDAFSCTSAGVCSSGASGGCL
ncbi:MAG: hypothetical protein QM687_10810 [Ferruginibacter sp.]